MTSKERVVTTLEHREPDRVPVGEWGVDHDVAEKVLRRETLFRFKAETTLALWEGKRDEVVDAYKRDLVELVTRLDHDLVPVFLVPPAGLEAQEVEKLGSDSFKDSWGQVWRYSAGNDSMLLLERPKRSFETTDDLRNYFESELVSRFGFRIKEKDDQGYRLELDDPSRLELVNYVVENLGKEKFIFARGFEEDVGNVEPLYFSEFEAMTIFFGGTIEDFYITLAMRPDLVAEAARLYTFVSRAMAEVFLEAGVDAVMPGGDFSTAQGPMISPASIREMFYPIMKGVAERARESRKFALTHNCGNNWLILDILVAAGFHGWQSIQIKTADMDLGRLKEKYGGTLGLWGGINLETLIDGRPDETRQEVIEALRTAAPGGGFILGTSNSVAYGSSYDNYMAALDALHEFGDYPVV